MTLGEYLRDLRKAAGYSQNGLAKESGVNVAYINRIENGKQAGGLSRHMAFCIARPLNLDAQTLDRLLWLAGLAPVVDWQTRALNAEAVNESFYRKEASYRDSTGNDDSPEDRYRSGDGQ